MCLTDHYLERLQSMSSDLDMSIMKRLDTAMLHQYVTDHKSMSIEQKIQLLTMLEESVAQVA